MRAEFNLLTQKIHSLFREIKTATTMKHQKIFLWVYFRVCPRMVGSDFLTLNQNCLSYFNSMSRYQ